MNYSKLPAHAKYSPSSASRIISCPLSVSLSELAPPQKESEFAAEGTRVHEECENALINLGANLRFISDKEVHDCVKTYFDHCDPLIEAAQAYGIESKAVFSEELFGTVDCYAFVDGVLHIIDYKHGQGVVVNPEKNAQLMTYAGLILADSNIDIYADAVDEVCLTVVQPRAGGEPIRSWYTSTDEIEFHMEQLFDAINEATSDNPSGAMGDHCRWCAAKLNCPVIKAAETGVKDWDSRDLSTEELGQLLADAQVIEMKIKELFSYAHAKLEEGVYIQGWKLVPKRAQRKWTDIEKLNAWAKRNGHLQKLYEKKLITPAAACKILDADSLNQFIESKSSGTNLKPVSDPAEEVMSLGGALSAIGSLS